MHISTDSPDHSIAVFASATLTIFLTGFANESSQFPLKSSRIPVKVVELLLLYFLQADVRKALQLP